jgi:2-haloacid dehalogenase
MADSSRSTTEALGSSAEALLSTVDLVTFDCFGTLVDWEKALPSLGVAGERMPVFLRESERRQRPDRRDAGFLGYREILEQVGAILRPDLPPEQVAQWGRRFGELPFFDDVPAGIALLGAMVDVGVISNCDAVHQLDITRRLGRPWDVCVVSEELCAYKPTDRAWDRAIAAVQSRGYDRDHWLHVSAWDDYDLAPATARGLRTAFIPRPGGVAPQSEGVDVVFPDVLSLARAIAHVRGGPIAYEVEAEATNGEIMRRFVEWLEDEHLADVRACKGVRRAELIELDGLRVRGAYRFDSRASFARYLERDAPRLRARGRELFGEDEIVLTRVEGTVRHVI